MNTKYNIDIYIFILYLLFIVISHTGFWYMPNINGQYIVSQNLTVNPFPDPNAHYIYTNYFQPLIFGGRTLFQYLIYVSLISIIFFYIFFIWFVRFHSINIHKDFYKFFPIIIFPVFFVPFYWAGMDGMTLLLMLLILINLKSKWSILFAVLLGLQHFEQGLAGFLLLFGSITLYNIFSNENKNWSFLKDIIYVLLGIILGKLILHGWLNIAEIKIIGNRNTYLEKHLMQFFEQWIASWPYIIFSLFGIGWILILKNFKYTYPLLVVSIVAFSFLMTVGDQTRVGTIILFPSLFYWIFRNKKILKTIKIKFSISMLVLYLLFPVVYVWGGYPFGSLLKYDLNTIYAIRAGAFNYDIMVPFQRDKTCQFNSIILNASQLNSKIGVINHSYRIARKNIDKPGYITYGPYISLPAGSYKFDINYISSESNTTVVGRWDVVIALPKQAKVLNEGNLLGTEGIDGHIVENFIMPNKYAKQKIEIRNYYNGTGELTIKSLTITRIQ